MRFSELTPSDLGALRVLAALELAYPVQAEKQGNRRASVILAGHGAWMARRQGLGG